MTSANIDMFCEGMKAFRNNVPFDSDQDHWWKEGWLEQRETESVKAMVRILKG